MTRKIIFLLSVLLVSLSAEAESRIDKLLRNLHDKNSQYVFVIAHRGDWRNAPENSIQCIENAIAMGADMVELDIQQTKDNNFICMHDATLDRTSTGKGAIKNYTTTELKQFVLNIKATESFIKDFTPIAYELCFKDEQTSNLKVIDKIVQSGSRVWMNTLWDSLCGGHDDENALLEGKDKHWGWILEHKATMIQTDRPQELIKYLEDKGLRKL